MDQITVSETTNYILASSTCASGGGLEDCIYGYTSLVSVNVATTTVPTSTESLSLALTSSDTAEAFYLASTFLVFFACFWGSALLVRTWAKELT